MRNRAAPAILSSFFPFSRSLIGSSSSSDRRKRKTQQPPFSIIFREMRSINRPDRSGRSVSNFFKIITLLLFYTIISKRVSTKYQSERAVDRTNEKCFERPNSKRLTLEFFFDRNLRGRAGERASERERTIELNPRNYDARTRPEGVESIYRLNSTTESFSARDYTRHSSATVLLSKGGGGGERIVAVAVAVEVPCSIFALTLLFPPPPSTLPSLLATLLSSRLGSTLMLMVLWLLP